jgi:DNA polymerase-1
VPDFIGLKGDTSDDIPGVPGIGDKTASDLLVRFGSLEGILANLPAVPGEKRRETLAAHAEVAEKSKQLATIERDLPLDVDVQGLVAEPPDRAGIKDFFRRFEFRNLLYRLDELEEALPAAPREMTGVTVEWSLGELADVEPFLSGVEEAAIAAENGHVAIAREDAVLLVPGAAEDLAGAIDGTRLDTHDYKAFGRELSAKGVSPAFDTQLAAYLIDPGRSEYLVRDLLEDHAIELVVEGEDETQTDVVRAAAGALRLRQPLAERLAQVEMDDLYARVELPLVEVLCAMELAGVQVDAYRLSELAAKLTEQVEELQARAHELAGTEFALGSPKQLGEVLFERLALPAGRKSKTGYSTDAKVLARIRDQHEIVAVVEEWRELSKLLGTYVLPFPELLDDKNRLHTTFSQTTASTGRLSAQKPNLQNIPIRTPVGREIRATFIAAEGCRLLSCDYSQVELRILAHLSGEELLRDAFARGDDIHAVTAAEVLGKPIETLTKEERNRAKAVNFGIVYGISSFGLSEQLGIERDEAQAYIDRYRGRMPRVTAFIESAIETARERGYSTTLFGRRRPVPELRAQNRQVRGLGERLAVNSVIQGSAADIIKVAMIRIHRRLREEGLQSRLVLQIHDELLVEVPDVETSTVRELVRQEMVEAYELDPALAVDAGIGDTWLEAKE